MVNDALQTIAKLYADIFEYQALVLRQLSFHAPRRAFRSILLRDNWKSKLENIKKLDERCRQFTNSAVEADTQEFYRRSILHDEERSKIQREMLDLYREMQRQEQTKSRDKDEAAILQNLASDYRSDKDFVSVRVLGTCEWFFKNDQFLDWRESTSSNLLRVSAGPGCGKSVLTRTLIDECKLYKNVTTSTVCYFFFKDDHDRRTSGTDALSALLHQLFENTSLISHALPSCKRHGDKLRKTFSELWEILIRCAQDSEAGDIICVLDALDECGQEARSQLLQKLSSLLMDR